MASRSGRTRSRRHVANEGRHVGKREQFERRRDLMVELDRGIPRVRCARPDGAYYVFCDVSTYLGRVPDDVKLSQVLLEEHGVAVVPGSAFGQPGYLRLSFATSEP